jgi:hypothetical protein
VVGQIFEASAVAVTGNYKSVDAKIIVLLQMSSSTSIPTIPPNSLHKLIGVPVVLV